ncbi:FkbM family methyltransferase [Sphingomonas sp.]|uniref:FkbM family methyltransferase n=1 Tax=Sphingomonas sp. TaxID=28214 RepID=UPI0035BC2BCD
MLAEAALGTLSDRLGRLHERVEQRRSATALRERLAQGCWVYGAGGYGLLAIRVLRDAGVDVRGVIDRRANDPAFAAGQPVPAVAPDSLTPAMAAGATLVVGVHNFAADLRPIHAWGAAHGFADVVVPAELPDLLGPALGSYWLTGRGHTARHLDELDRLAPLLADDASRAVLDGIAAFRISADLADHPPSHLPSQYFPPDVPLTRAPLRLVDGGAFTGDAWPALTASGRTLGEWYAFEPDPVNFRALVATAREAPMARTALFPCGLGERAEQIRFASGEAAGSHAAENGDTVIQIVALDEVLPGISPNYVKLDIEGAERAALSGMRETLARARPAIAISIYHRPEDLWELPLLIHDRLPDHRLFIRQHGYNGFDTVLYAVP